MTGFPIYDTHHPALMATWARDYAGGKVYADTAKAMTELAAAIRFDALREAGLAIEEYEVSVGEADVEVQVGWCAPDHRIHAVATDYDKQRWRGEAFAVEWAQSVESAPDPLTVSTQWGEAPF